MAGSGGTYSLRRRAGGRTTDPASDPKTRSSGSFPFETSFLGEKISSQAVNNFRGGMGREQKRRRLVRIFLISNQQLLAVSRLMKLVASAFRLAGVVASSGSPNVPQKHRSPPLSGEERVHSRLSTHEPGDGAVMRVTKPMRLKMGFLCNLHLHAPYLEEKRSAARRSSGGWNGSEPHHRLDETCLSARCDSILS